MNNQTYMLMKKLIPVLIAAAAAIAFCACTSNKKTMETTESPRTLILYYSQTGTTRLVADELKSTLNADIAEVTAKDPYSGNFDETIQRCLAEMQAGTIPAIDSLTVNIAEYDTIFLGYPIWFGTYARPIMGLLDTCDFSGKTIVPFCTFGSGGLEASTADLKKAQPKANVLEGYGVRQARIAKMPAELKQFLIDAGFVPGEKSALAAFPEPLPVTAAEVATFDAACGGYEYPLGTPVMVAKRPVPSGTEHKFIVNGKGPDGSDTQNAIYVIADSTSTPEFTKVVPL